MSAATLPDKYRAVNKTDVIEIRRNENCEFNPEPTTICKVGLLERLVSCRSLRDAVKSMDQLLLLLARRAKSIRILIITRML